MSNKMLVGALERCHLPDLEIENLHIRVDTGAATSSLHVDNIEEFKNENELWVAFDIHPDYHDVSKVVRRQAPVLDTRIIKSSSGERQKRHVIETQIILGEQKWSIHISLSDRSSMSYLMLLGRQAMNGHVIVDPEGEYLLEA